MTLELNERTRPADADCTPVTEHISREQAAQDGAFVVLAATGTV